MGVRHKPQVQFLALFPLAHLFHFDPEAQVVCAVSIADGGVEIDGPLTVEVEEGLVEGLHPFTRALGHGFLQQVDLSFMDQVLNPGRIQKEFHGCDPSPVRAGHQALRNDGLEVQGKLEVICRCLSGERSS